MRPGASRRAAGFTLVEALVALVVAGFTLPALARAMSQAWTATRTPMETVSALMLARGAASGEIASGVDVGRRGFNVERQSQPAEPSSLASDVAPAPGGGEKDDDGPEQGLRPQATPGGMKLALPKGLGGPPTGAAAAAALSLHRVSIVVRTPSGRRIAFEAVRLDDASR